MIPHSSPTSQNDPCSNANSTAVDQNANGVYFPRGTLLKSVSCSQRGSHPRQNNSSSTGTSSAARDVRNTSISGVNSPGGIDVLSWPTIAFWKRKLLRHPGKSASGAIHITNTARPTPMLASQCGALRGSTCREKKRI